MQAEPGNRRALFQLGRGFDAGGAYSEARRWYEKAAALGHAPAMSNLGVLYQKGQGVQQDDVEARRWFEKAAALGNELAKTNLATLR